MNIVFAKARLAKVFNSLTDLNKTYGQRLAKAIAKRMAVLKKAKTLANVPVTKPERCHQLIQDRDETFAVDLVQPNRLVFEVSHNPIPRKRDGGIDMEQVTDITIIEVTDYH